MDKIPLYTRIERVKVAAAKVLHYISISMASVAGAARHTLRLAEPARTYPWQTLWMLSVAGITTELLKLWKLRQMR
jgi:hypothetical protein